MFYHALIFRRDNSRKELVAESIEIESNSLTNAHQIAQHYAKQINWEFEGQTFYGQIILGGK